MGLALQASLFVRFGEPAAADAFCASRLADARLVYGTLPAGIDTAAIVDRHRPRI
jgi:putative acyl-CoA dehydrogenase